MKGLEEKEVNEIWRKEKEEEDLRFRVFGDIREGKKKGRQGILFPPPPSEPGAIFLSSPLLLFYTPPLPSPFPFFSSSPAHISYL